MTRIFITGTDTGVGKTYMSCRLLEHYNDQGLKTIALKPVATGVSLDNNQNDDAERLQKAASVKLSYNQVNPYCFILPTAPSIAAAAENVELKVEKIVEHIERTAQIPHDVTIIEGVGGVNVPFNNTQTQVDLIKALHCPIILVVEIKLGCINHALLSVECLRSREIQIHGWVPNYRGHHMLNVADNVETLQHWLEGVPYLNF